MKRLVVVVVIMAAAGGVIWSERRQVVQTRAEGERLRVELQQLDRHAAEVETASVQLASAATTRQQSLDHQRERAVAEALSRSVVTNSFGPRGGTPEWSENEGFVWLEKKGITALGIVAFRAADGGEAEPTPDGARMVNRLSKQFFEEHPEFARTPSLTPDKAAQAKAAYVKFLADAAAGLDDKGRQTVEVAILQAEQSPRPGAMTQPSATYRLNENAATLLGMTAAERGVAEQATAEMIERYHELERQHVSESDDHAGGVSGSPHGLATFKVNAFPDEGGALKTAWADRLKAILGEERTQYLLEMSANWIHSDLGDFGEAERAITFREGTGSGGYSDSSTKGYRYSQGTGGPSPIPPGWRHLIARPEEGGIPRLRSS